MASAKGDVAHGDDDSKIASADTTTAEAASQSSSSRRRTKTGCLTCRKRRIKCGEESPICRNCTKSRRVCEGYNHLRAPTRLPQPNHTHYQNGSATFVFPTIGNHAHTVGSHAQGHPFHHHSAQLHPQSWSRPILPVQHDEPRLYDRVQPQYHPGYHAATSSLEQTNMTQTSLVEAQGQTFQQAVFFPATRSISSTMQTMPVPQATGDEGPSSNFYIPSVNRDFTIHQMYAKAHQPADSLQLASGLHWDAYSDHAAGVPHDKANTQVAWQSSLVPRPELMQAIDPRPGATHPRSASKNEQDNINPGSSLEAATVEAHDDASSGVESDDEMDTRDMDSLESNSQHGSGLAIMSSMKRLTLSQSGPLGYRLFAAYNSLDHYRPEWAANPLRNATTARVFAHFIVVTGPTLSVFERPTRFDNLACGEGSVPLSPQGLWTHAMPMAALHHQGLLHAVLAISSLHIANLTGASTTPSIKHYAYALKRIHHCVGHAKKRHSVPVLAASLLLGFYEIMAADHMKWNSHLAGAKQLVVETGFAGMTREFKMWKTAQAERDQQHMYAQYQAGMPPPFHPPRFTPTELFLDSIPEVDEDVVGTLAGKQVCYSRLDSVLDDDDASGHPNPKGQPLDLVRFEVLKDLFWWYCKQDVIQTLISGNALLMKYNRWTDCPPRAPMNMADAVYGSFDHLVLLMGRISDYVVRDRKRKVKVVEANGGQWRPAPGMQIGSPSGQETAPPPGRHARAANDQPSRSKTKTKTKKPSTASAALQQMQPGPPGPSPPLPAFYGMAPPPPNTDMPASYQASHTSPSPDTQQSYDNVNLDAALESALDEWGQLRAALDAFKNMLGDDFQPLASQYQTPFPTPFGTALIYRSYDIGTLWATYYTACIVATRSHPHMPPHAHMAAAVAAQQTRDYATSIGRIVAGIVPPPAAEAIEPRFGAALCEHGVPLFFAGVQLQAAAQREWVVSRLFETERRCGWATAGLIANGCQTAWAKAFKAGRGPPYERRYNTMARDERVNGTWESVGMAGQPAADDERDRRFVHTKATARLHWAIGIIGMEDDA